MNLTQKAARAVNDLLAANGAPNLEVDMLIVEPKRGIVAMTLRKRPVIIEGDAVDVPGAPINNMPKP